MESNIIEDICIWNYTRGNITYDKGFEYRMLEEEFEEYLVSTNTANECKELCDIVFVALGSLYKLADNNKEKVEGIMMSVIEANYKKGTAKVGGKVQKGVDYKNPEDVIDKILNDGQKTWDSYLNGNEHIYEGV